MKKLFRDFLHVLAGAFIAFLLSLTFQGSNPIPEFVVVIIVTTVAGGLWEIGWNLYNKSVVDKYDVLRTVIGGLIFLTFRLIL